MSKNYTNINCQPLVSNKFTIPSIYIVRSSNTNNNKCISFSKKYAYFPRNNYLLSVFANVCSCYSGYSCNYPVSVAVMQLYYQTFVL